MKGKADVHYENSIFTVKCGPLLRGSCYHWHNDVEILLIENGSADYLLGGNLFNIQAGQFAMFWGSIPHTAIRVERDNTVIYWIHLPMSRFLQWEMPKEMVKSLLAGKFIMEEKSSGPADLALVKKWVEEWKLNTPAMHNIMLLEIQARLCRLALRMKASIATAKAVSQTGEAGIKNDEKSMEIMQYITEHYTEPLTSLQIAKATGLNLENAVSRFRKSFGTSFFKFILQMRISHAQRLLATTDDKILEIALESGFGSESRFYVSFKRHCGHSPNQYRAQQKSSLAGQAL